MCNYCHLLFFFQQPVLSQEKVEQLTQVVSLLLVDPLLDVGTLSELKEKVGGLMRSLTTVMAKRLKCAIFAGCLSCGGSEAKSAWKPLLVGVAIRGFFADRPFGPKPGRSGYTDPTWDFARPCCHLFGDHHRVRRCRKSLVYIREIEDFSRAPQKSKRS